MCKTFSCNYQNCNYICEKKSELKKHLMQHKNPQLLHPCPQCDFVTIYANNLRNHANTHLDEKPFVCPDMIRYIRNEGSSSQPTVSEKPCTYRSNCDSALIKHRRKYHGYVTHDKRSLALQRQDMTTSNGSQADHTTTPSSNGSLAAPPHEITSSSNQSSRLISAHPPIGFEPPPVQPFDSNHHSAQTALNARYVEACKHILTIISINAQKVAALQSNHGYSSAAAQPLPVLPNNPATVSHQNSAVSAHLPSAPPNNAALFWSLAGTSEADVVSDHSASVSSYTSHGYNVNSPLASSHVTLPPAGLPLNSHPVPYPDTLHSEGSNARAFAQEFINGTSAVAAQYDYADSSHSTTTPSLPILPNTPAIESHHESNWESSYIASDDSTHTSSDLSDAAIACAPQADSTDSGSFGIDLVNDDSNADVDDVSESSGPEIGPGLLEFEMELHEDDIFFRGTGREGCLCPEVLADAGVEGWDSSLLADDR